MQVVSVDHTGYLAPMEHRSMKLMQANPAPPPKRRKPIGRMQMAASGCAVELT
jgi:hypothetical protein